MAAVPSNSSIKSFANTVSGYTLEVAAIVSGVLLYIDGSLAGPAGLIPIILIVIAAGMRNARILMLLKTAESLKKKTTLVEDQLRSTKHQDLLTGLLNRLGLTKVFQEVAVGEDGNEGLFVAMIAIDEFKTVNDLNGHQVGDSVLQQVAHRLERTIETASASSPELSTHIARVGGDEFGILAEGASKQLMLELAEQIQASMRRPFIFGRQNGFLSVSVGLSSEVVESAPLDMIKQADVAVQSIKRNHGNLIRFFEPEMLDIVNAKKEISAKLNRAIANNEFHLVYQPKVSAASGAVTGYEALLRWSHPTEGMISPAVFIPMAEEVGLINQVGGWVFKRLCKDIRSLENAGWRDFRISFNVSPKQLRDSGYASELRDGITQHGINPEHLEIEITEHSLVCDFENTSAHLRTIKSMGIRIAIDDFGTGCSSLTYIERLPIDTLKIDKSFISGCHRNQSRQSIVRAVSAMAKSLGLMTVAEGVESIEENQAVMDIGCDYIQGFYYYRPMPLSEIKAAFPAP